MKRSSTERKSIEAAVTPLAARNRHRWHRMLVRWVLPQVLTLVSKEPTSSTQSPIRIQNGHNHVGVSTRLIAARAGLSSRRTAHSHTIDLDMQR